MYLGVQIGIANSQVMQFQDELCHDIGSRLTSSRAFDRAADWAVEQFQEMGLDARLDQWGEWKTGWDRGGPSPAREFGLARMPCPPVRVLIPACGRGYEIAELASRGCRVTGVDFAQSAVTDLQEILQM